LLVALELAEREDGETLVDGVLKSNLHKYSGKLLFVPAGHELRGSQKPRVLTRAICLYIDPQGPLMPPEAHFDETGFKPRLYFEDSDLWDTAQKLKRQVERPTTANHAEALGAVLAYELMQMEEHGSPDPREVKGGLAAWQKKAPCRLHRAASCGTNLTHHTR
jgi:AraC family transcriptional regulator